MFTTNQCQKPEPVGAFAVKTEGRNVSADSSGAVVGFNFAARHDVR